MVCPTSIAGQFLVFELLGDYLEGLSITTSKSTPVYTGLLEKPQTVLLLTGALSSSNTE